MLIVYKFVNFKNIMHFLDQKYYNYLVLFMILLYTKNNDNIYIINNLHYLILPKIYILNF